ncbi:hypothetical protein K501DRAFT_255991 [Backusella circina FSU 941]|nr:hypothetical protein K501DRAFT_255991 [Backusella circina FSU 941]
MSHARDSLQYSNQKQVSLPTVYEENDPYRTMKKTPRLESISDNSDGNVVHSRTASDSSTTKLNTTIPQRSFYDDPYSNRKPRATRVETDRAYSYLPYSHHQRDPNQAPPTTIYIESESAPPSSSLGIGSLLHDDNYASMNEPIRHKEPNHHQNSMALPERKNRRKRICGLSYRMAALLLLVFVIVIIVIWYFVWPRVPSLSLDDIDVNDQLKIPTNTTQKTISTSWLVNISADNSANWVPTRIQYWDVTITDDTTNRLFGQGQTGSFVLPPRKTSIITLPMNIYYETTNENDTTFQDLYNACGIQEKTPVADQTKQGRLNATFHVTHHISGIVWSPTSSIPAIGLDCPT